ncbi:MAG: hypothetical protein DRP79_02890, partial [Planctomycetota bacterium]
MESALGHIRIAATRARCRPSLVGSRGRSCFRRLALEELEQRLALSNYSLGVVSDGFSMDGLDVTPEAGSDSFDFEFADGALGLCARIDSLEGGGSLDLRLHDDHGALVDASCGVSEEGEVSLQALAPGHYTLRVVAHGGASADYSLSLGAPEPLVAGDWAEGNNSSGVAYDLGAVEGYNQWSDLSIHSSTDRDWFRFEISGDGEAGQYVGTEFTHALGDLDMKLYNSSVQFVASSTGTSDSEHISLEGLSAGTYYVCIYGYGGATNPDYALTIDASPGLEIAEDAFEQNDGMDEAYNLGVLVGHDWVFPGLTMDNSINEPVKEDWFVFETVGRGAAGDVVRIEFSQGMGDLDMKLCGPTGLTIAVSEGTGDVEQIGLDNLVAGTYYLKVYGYNGASNPGYTLTVDAPDEPGPVPADSWEVNDTIEQAYDLQTVEGRYSWDLTLHDGDTADWFMFATTETAAAGNAVTLSFAEGEEWGLEVRDSSGNILPTTTGDDGEIIVDMAGHEADTFHGVVTGGDSPAHYALTIDAPEELPEWTILAYLNGDDDGGSWSTETYSIMKVNAMEAVAPHSEVQVGILMDRIAGYESTSPDWTDTRVGVLAHDSDPDVMSTEFTSWGEKNVGLASTLQDYIDWGMSTLPAENYAIFFFGHGGGYRGALPDYTNGYDMLKPNELANALSQADDRAGILGFDGCLMGAVEVAYEVSPFVDVYIGSEEVEYVPGWDWDEVLEIFTDNPFATPDQIGSEIVDTLGVPWYIQTMSATDTGGMDTFTAALADFVDTTLEQGTPDDWNAIEAARDAAPAFDEPAFVDLGGFMREVADRVSTEDISSAAQAVLNEYDGLILNNYSNPTSEGTGLSIFLPEVGASISWSYRHLSFADAAHWEGFLDAFTSGVHVQPDWAEPNDTLEDACALGEVSDESFDGLTLTPGDQDWFSLDVPSGTDGTLRMTVDYVESEGGLAVSLHDGDGLMIQSVDGSDGTAMLEVSAPDSGTYYLHIDGSPTEDCLNYSLDIFEKPPTYPDLHMSIYNVDLPGGIDAGDAFVVLASAANTGDADVAPGQEFHVAYYLSTDDVPDEGDLLLEAVNPDDLVIDEGLAAGGTNPSFGAELILPDAGEGDYYIVARIDSADEIDEGPDGEDNNTAATPEAAIHITDEPPVIEDLAAEPDTVAQGETLVLTAHGVSDLEGPVSTVEFYVDADGDGAFDPGIDTLLGADTDGGDGWSWSGPA